MTLFDPLTLYVPITYSATLVLSDSIIPVLTVASVRCCGLGLFRPHPSSPFPHLPLAPQYWSVPTFLWLHLSFMVRVTHRSPSFDLYWLYLLRPARFRPGSDPPCGALFTASIPFLLCLFQLCGIPLLCIPISACSGTSLESLKGHLYVYVFFRCLPFVGLMSFLGLIIYVEIRDFYYSQES